LRAVVDKALAGNPRRRYPSAQAFQADLQAFLEHRPTAAELERRSVWSRSPNATIEAAREYLRKATRTMRRARARLKATGAVAWFAAGMALWIGGSYAWQGLKARPIPAAAGATPDLMLPTLYIATAERVLEGYQTSADPSLHDFDWQKAEVCLARAMELGSGDDQTLGKLALSRGYAVLERLSGGQYSETAAAQMRESARDLFANAALKLPRDPAPHLALARLYVYSLPNVDEAMTEFAAAQRLGVKLGRREIEQEGDAYRLRAKREADAGEWDDAEKDVAAARRQYLGIPGFDQVDVHLRELGEIHRPVVKRPVVKQTRRPGRWR
jgi:hypothetical protein